MIVEHPVVLTERYPGIIADTRTAGKRLCRQGDENRRKKRVLYYTFSIFQTFGVVIRNSPDSLNDPR
jgi:hypothetical protein